VGRRTVHARDCAVLRSPMARWWLAGSKVQLGSTRKLPQGCQWKEWTVAHRGNGSTCGGGAEAARRCSRVAEALRRSVGVGTSSYNIVHRGAVRSGGVFGRRTRGGGAHREVATTAMVARQAARSGRGMDTGADERSKAWGGTARRALRGKTEEGTNGHGGVGRCPF
jgi:hypothetical protein